MRRVYVDGYCDGYICVGPFVCVCVFARCVCGGEENRRQLWPFAIVTASFRLVCFTQGNT